MQEKAHFSDAEQDAIKRAATKVLDHESFRASERSTRLFRYLLDRAISNETELLKERLIGHEVFGRDISYDTSNDPIVRNAASDTRRRLRQYDAENGADESVRILLAPGTYILDFRFSAPSLQAETQQKAEVESGVPGESEIVRPSSVQTPPRSLAWRNTQIAYGVTLLSTVCCIFLALTVFRQQQELKLIRPAARAMDPLWSPMFSAGKEVFICLGHADPLRIDDPSIGITSGGLQRITVTDLKSYTNISGFLQMNGQSFQMRMDNQTTLLDLREHPTVLIGNHNNDWALKLTGNLRFRFDFDEADAGKPNQIVSIVDAQEPHRLWQVPLRDQKGPSVDYAIAGRFFDPVSGSLILFVAGAGTVGTQAASEFVTQPQFLRGLPESLRNPKTNIELVLKTPIIAGVAGAPEVVATHVW